MADVQLKNGFTQIADELYEALIRSPIPGRHKDCVHAIIRLTYGYRKKADKIGSIQIAEILDVSPTFARRLLRDLDKWGVITRVGGGKHRGDSPMVCVVKDFDSWSIGSTEDADRQSVKRRLSGTYGEQVPLPETELSGTYGAIKRNVSADKAERGRSTPKRTDIKREGDSLKDRLEKVVPGFGKQIRPAKFYAAFALPAGNPAAIEYTIEDVAIWHAWMWSKGKLAKYKPRGMKAALKNCWWYSTKCGDEVQAAKNWLANLALVANRPAPAPESPCDESELDLVFSDVVAK